MLFFPGRNALVVRLVLALACAGLAVDKLCAVNWIFSWSFIIMKGRGDCPRTLKKIGPLQARWWTKAPCKRSIHARQTSDGEAKHNCTRRHMDCTVACVADWLCAVCLCPSPSLWLSQFGP
jgi:hypothetical protein